MMNQENNNNSASDSEYEPATDGIDGGEEDWWDAEEQGDMNDDSILESRSNPSREKDLRRKILEIQRNEDLSKETKSKLMQELISSRPSPSSEMAFKTQDTDVNSSNSGQAITSYHNKAEGIMGCKHYQRKCKLQAFCCGEMYVCRFCHDDAADHQIVRHDTKNMQCMVCSTVQPASKTCAECGIEVARYYCDKCKLWDDDPKKPIFHCDACGICRKGRGLGNDYFHCDKCNICMAIKMKDKHRCIERNLESDCPICGEYMFTSTTTVIFMPCGHSMHKPCYSDYILTSYQCPTCLKSLGDMSQYFSNLDRELERQSMPPEYEKHISNIFCNDCEKKSPTKYHFFYHKCHHCGSYNTTVLSTETPENRSQSSSIRDSATPGSADPGPNQIPPTSSSSTNGSAADAFRTSNSMQNGIPPSNSTISSLGIRIDRPSSGSSSSSRPRPNGANENEG